MKTRFKPASRLVAALSFVMFAPAIVYAEPATSPSATVDTGAFCTTNLTPVTSKITSATTTAYEKLETDENQRITNIDSDAANVQTKIATSRAGWDTKRQTAYSTLSSKATAAEQPAVIAFENSVNDAVTTRRAAVDAADNAFKQSLLNAVNTRQTQIKTAATTYDNAVQNALTHAAASCIAGTKPATVRLTLQASLKTARTNLASARTASDKVGGNLDSLKATRRAAVAAADATFKTTTDAARATLKATLQSGKASGTPVK